MRFTAILLVLFSSKALTQKFEPFTGKLTYLVVICDTNLQKIMPPQKMIVYTNDTLIRVENQTDRLGNQIVIKHLVLNKSYLLLSTEYGKYAIQTDHSSVVPDSLPYRFKKKCGSKKLCGVKMKKAIVSRKGFDEDLEFLYWKNKSPKYLNNFDNAPGLPTRYYIPTPDGIFKYELIDIQWYNPNKDLFGVDSSYQRVSFDEFLNIMFPQQPNDAGVEEKHE